MIQICVLRWLFIKIICRECKFVRQTTVIEFGLNIIEENGLAFFVLIGDVDKFNKAFQSTVYFQNS